MTELKELIAEMGEAYEKLTGIEKEEVLKGLSVGDVKVISNPTAASIAKKMIAKEKKMVEKKTREIVNEKEEGVVTEIQGKDVVEMVEKKERRNLELNDIIVLAGTLYKSRLFTSIQSAEQAVAQIVAGQELGLAPVYSLNHLFIIPGKPPAVDGQAMANMVRRAGYSYKALKHEQSKSWTLGFYQGNQFLGEASFSVDEANRVGLTKKGVWQQYADDMLFWRALSRGARRWCPDAISGSYLVEELDIEVKDVTPSNIVVEGEINVKEKEEPKALSASTETKPESPSRETLLQGLVEKYSKETIKKCKDKMKIEGSLKVCNEIEWQKLIKELEK